MSHSIPSIHTSVSKIGMAAPKPVKNTETEKLRKTSQDFEALFINQLFQEMRSSSNSSWDITGGGKATEMYQSMMDEELSKKIAAHGGIGLGAMMEAQVQKTLNPTEKSH